MLRKMSKGLQYIWLLFTILCSGIAIKELISGGNQAWIFGLCALLAALMFILRRKANIDNKEK